MSKGGCVPGPLGYCTQEFGSGTDLSQEKTDPVLDRVEALRLAAANGDLEVVRSLHQTGVDIRSDSDAALRAAAAQGHLDVLRYLHQNGVDVLARGSETFLLAAAHGHVDVVQYLHQNGMDLRTGTDEVLRLAAAHGHLEIVRYIRENGADLWVQREEMLRLAAANGHLATVRYLHEYGVNLSSVRAGGHALRCAAAGGHGEVVKYLHENGATTADLSHEGRACLEAMTAEIAAAPEIYHPSAFWQEVGTGHARLLSWTGEAHFKRTVNQNFFHFIPTDSGDPRIEHLTRLIPSAEVRTRPEYRLESPDCDPALWTSWLPSYQVFQGDRCLQEELYLRWVRALYEFVLMHDPDGVLLRLQEPLLGNPIRVWRGQKLISQDLAHSAWERSVILAGLPHRESPGSLVIAELGAGYGRLGHVLLASADCRYIVFDIPPALCLSQWYLSNLFPEKRLFRFQPFREFSEVEAELSQADIAFCTANQLEKFPERYFDLFINISSLHEMRREQVDLFLSHMARTTRRLIYLKEYESYRNPYDHIIIEHSDYVLPEGWEVVVERPDILNPDFFELLARPSTGSPRRGEGQPD